MKGFWPERSGPLSDSGPETRVLYRTGFIARGGTSNFLNLVLGHRSRAVWEFVQQQRGPLGLEYLPGYAPELNPVEYLWSPWKQHELPNFCPQDFAQLSIRARRALQRMRRRPTLVCAFWEQAELFPL